MFLGIPKADLITAVITSGKMLKPGTAPVRMPSSCPRGGGQKGKPEAPVPRVCSRPRLCQPRLATSPSSPWADGDGGGDGTCALMFAALQRRLLLLCSQFRLSSQGRALIPPSPLAQQLFPVRPCPGQIGGPGKIRPTGAALWRRGSWRAHVHMRMCTRCRIMHAIL